ncbi:hypothetical protein L5I01_21960 [Gordonia sp. HY442]|uniref:hypothetical protein n=1 Tax=Gordonia zhenghanii TaxID=2911516 RepID=UPI001F41DC2D|nr:hypothetical protein [Gordonia zhenghanii]MCF8606021.1 hypothetical protein [Gordonia zhenghanii]
MTEGEGLRPEGMRALQRERVENLQLRRELRQARTQLHNLRADVITLTNELIDLIEGQGAVRTHHNTGTTQ